MRLFTLTTLLACAQYVLSQGVTITLSSATTAAGSPLTLTFADAGGSPAFPQLQKLEAFLMFGGNDANSRVQMVSLGAVVYPTATLTGTIPAAGAANIQSIANGFYIMTVGTAAAGTVYNYSPRFSVTGETGKAAAAMSAGITAAAGAAPGTQYVANAAAAPAAGGATQSSMFDVSYQMQTGLTKYAPMQSVPPTRITKKNATPLYPTSAYITASTFLPPASILTTVTLAQTFSVVSVENSAAPQSHPTGDMAKYLARWKD